MGKQQMTDVQALLEQYRKEPYERFTLSTPCSGIVSFNATLKEGDTVFPALGEWKEIPATVLATVLREGVHKVISSDKKAVVRELCTQYQDTFVEAGTPILALEHYLTKEEVIERILKKTLSLFCAPERAKYYFVPDIQKKIAASGAESVRVESGMPLFVMSRMKREITIPYEGKSGVIYGIYAAPTATVDIGEPLIGVCDESMLPEIAEIIHTIQSQWIVR